MISKACFLTKIKKLQPALAISVIAIFVVLGTILASFFIRGYRPDFKNKSLFPTGLLAANSVPKGALVYINEKLVTATDDTINLTPNDYHIKLVKDGYLPWEKEIKIKKEVVFQTNAHLFRAAPDLKPLTATGAINPILSLDGSRVVYAVASASAETKNGVWMSELSQSGFNPIRNGTKQLTRPYPGIDWSKASFVWSPDSSQVLAIFGSLEKPASAYLLTADRLTSSDQLRDVAFQLPFIINEWQEEREKELRQQLEELPKEWQAMATQSASLVTFSPHEKRFFYLATKLTTIPENLLPHPPARSDQPEEREIHPGGIYVYDLEEDTNFFIIEADQVDLEWEKLLPTPTPAPPRPDSQIGEVEGEKITAAQILNQYVTTTQFPLYWLATNNHLLFIENSQIKVVEIDGGNKQTVFAGPFINGHVFPTPDGDRLIVLTSMHSHLPPNLYEVRIR